MLHLLEGSRVCPCVPSNLRTRRHGQMACHTRWSSSPSRAPGMLPPRQLRTMIKQRVNSILRCCTGRRPCGYLVWSAEVKRSGDCSDLGYPDRNASRPALLASERASRDICLPVANAAEAIQRRVGASWWRWIVTLGFWRPRVRCAQLYSVERSGK